MKYIITILLSILILSACNKEKRFSKRLMQGDVWTITNLTVNDQYYGYYGSWLVEDVDIYNAVPSIQWNANNQSTSFQWQFQDKGKTFEIVYKDPSCENCTTPPSDLAFQCYFLSGKYEVVTHKKDKMVFESNSTLGFNGKTVKIRIDKK